MGEWSDYFEDFPEEAPQPPSDEEVAKAKRDAQIRALNADAFALIAKTQRKAQAAEQQQKELYLDSTVECPQCGESRLNVYKLKSDRFLCECKACGIYGAGTDFSSALHQTAGAIGDDIDWRDGSLFAEYGK